MTLQPAVAPSWPGRALLLLALAGLILVRLHLGAFPMERDEGEYAYAGQLILQGEPPYGAARNMKLPGVYLANAACFVLLGDSPAAVRVGLTIAGLVAIVGVFVLARRWGGGEMGGGLAALFYALASTHPALLGMSGHATQYVAAAAILGCIALESALAAGSRPDGKRVFAAGLLFGLAFVMKQPGLAFLAYAALRVLAPYARPGGVRTIGEAFRPLLLLAAGGVLPFAAVCLWLWSAEVFPQFWFWTFSYASQYASAVSPSEGAAKLWRNSGALLAAGGWPLLVLALLGAAFALRQREGWRAAPLLLLLFSALAVCPGLYFRSHYFIVLLPALTVGAALAVTDAARLAGRISPHARLPSGVVLAATALLVPLLASVGRTNPLDYYFFLPPDVLCRQIYGANIFPESTEIANWIRSHSAERDTVAVLGSEPQLYFLSERRSATGHIYTYGLMEPQTFARRMQEEMIAEIVQAKPKVIVLIKSNGSWLTRDGSDPLIFQWAKSYLAANYRLTSVARVTAAAGVLVCLPAPPANEAQGDVLLYERAD